MKKLLFLIALFAAVLLQTGNAQAFTFNANGSLTEWGVLPGTFGHSDWTPDAGIFSAVEDQDPAVNYLNPGYGAQQFDAEAMYVKYDATNLYFAIVTGKDPGTGGGYRPGDIAFDFGSNGSYEYGIETTGGNAGKLYTVSSWNKGIWNNVDPTEMKVTGVLKGTGSLAYNNCYYGDNSKGNHYVIEGSIARSYFGSDWNNGFTMSWTQTCGNDVIRLNIPPTATPEPATMLLFGMGLAGVGVLRKRQFKA
jgi:hypothetical protein